MATFKALQLTNTEASPSVLNPSRDADARLRSTVFTVDTILGLVANDTIRYGTLKKGWRILGIQFMNSANWLAATATIALGITGTTAKYMAASAVGAAATEFKGATTIALGYGVVLAADEELIGTIAAAGAGSAPTAANFVVVTYVRD